MLQHYALLVNKKDAKANFLENLEHRGKEIFTTLEDTEKQRGLKVAVIQKLLEINIKCANDRQNIQANALVDLISCYFKEPISDLYYCQSQDCLVSDVCKDVPPQPFIVAIGTSICNASKFHIYIESQPHYSTTILAEALVYQF